MLQSNELSSEAILESEEMLELELANDFNVHRSLTPSLPFSGRIVDGTMCKSGTEVSHAEERKREEFAISRMSK